MVHQLDPDITCQQACCTFNHTLHKNHPGFLKPMLHVSQSTDTKQSGITVMNQYH